MIAVRMYFQHWTFREERVATSAEGGRLQARGEMAASALGSKAVRRGQTKSRGDRTRSRERKAVNARAASTPAAEDVPDMGRRTTMNWLVVGAWSAPVATMGWGYLALFVPPKYAQRHPKLPQLKLLAETFIQPCEYFATI